jgi:poly(3-hydroxybutyrate) depolymerase
MAGDDAHERGRLRARPSEPTGDDGAAGLRALDPGGARDGLALLQQQADAFGLILLALSSGGPTWDLVAGRGRCGPDVARVDEALEEAFSSHFVDPARVAIGGYSDGASYALSLGLANGDLFTHVMVFSPDFLAPLGRTGSPRSFVSHGTRDGWLPIDSCSRRIVPGSNGPATTSPTGNSTGTTWCRPRPGARPRGG